MSQIWPILVVGAAAFVIWCIWWIFSQVRTPPTTFKNKHVYTARQGGPSIEYHDVKPLEARNWGGSETPYTPPSYVKQALPTASKKRPPSVGLRNTHVEESTSLNRAGSNSAWRDKETPTRGLVIKAEALHKILDGRKTMELRSKPNLQLGPVALIEKGSKKIYAVANLVESVDLSDIYAFRKASKEHAVEADRINEVFAKGWTNGWVLADVTTLAAPVDYIHKGMSQVKLDTAAIDALEIQLRR